MEIDHQSFTDSADNSAFSETSPPDLAAVAAAWPHLPEHVRQAIITLVESVRDSKSAT
jgi:hypothetical protein